MNRRTLAVLVLACWAGALGWLVDRHYLGGGDETRARWPVPPGSAFHAVRLGERQYGLSSLTIDTLPEGLRVTELTTLDLPRIRPDTPRRTSARVEAFYTRGLQLIRWQSDMLTEEGRVASTGTMNGDSLTIINAPRGMAPETLLVRLRRPVVMPGAIPLVAASRGLPHPGDKLNLDVYDPLEYELRTERLVVAAESVFTLADSAEYSSDLRRWRVAHTDTVRAWRLDAVIHGLPVSRWVDAVGMTMRLDHALGARLDRGPFEIVNSNFRTLPPAPWDTTGAAPRFGPRQGEPLPRRHLTLVARLGPGLPLPDSVPALNGGWQERAGDTLRLGPRVFTDTAPESSRETDVLIGEGAEVARAASLLAGRETRPAEIARRLGEWTGRTIRLRSGAATRSAGAILASRSGTAEERVVLMVALARASGLEARGVWGLVDTPEGWEMRPWAELWIEGWVPVDPAAGGPNATVGRVRLATGGRPRLLELALRAGRLRLEEIESTQ